MSIKSSGKWRAIDPLDELREHPRFRVHGRVDVHGLELWSDLGITNLSVGGICVTVPMPSEIGTRVWLVLRQYEAVGPLTIEAEVKWASERRMGLQWIDESNGKDVLSYLNRTRIEVVPDERDR